ncbi:MAG: SdrD B-like domain-containing protein [Chloroflexota bacterium]
MNRLSPRQIWKTIARSTRTLLNAFLAASLLLGLIPPPLVSHVATHTADLTGFENLSGLGDQLADALTEPSAAKGAPMDASLKRGTNAPTHAPLAQTTVIFNADFESATGDNSGWTTTGSTASAGLWARGSQPQYSNVNYVVQIPPQNGGNNYATGLGADFSGVSGDVDDGAAILNSPSIALPAGQRINLTYDFYVGLNTATTNSYVRVEIVRASDDVVLETLYNIENMPHGVAAVWTPHAATLSDYAGETVYLRVTANDGDGFIVESAIDNVQLATSAPTSLGGQVWHDTDDNGQFDGGEGGLSGILVELLDENQLPVDDPAAPGYQGAVRLTEPNGSYAFDDVPPGNYMIRIATPPGDYGASSTATSTTDNGIDNDDNGIQSEAGRTILSPVIAISDGETDETIDFGLVASPTLPTFLYSTLPTFNWRNAGDTAGAEWLLSDTTRTWTTNYTDIFGNPETLDVTMTIIDPDNRNIDPDVFDAGSHPFDPSGGCDPLPASIDDVLSPGSVDDPWDSECRLGSFATETNGDYGADYLTFAMKAEDATERVTLRFTFDKVVRITNLSVSDIDANGQGWSSRSGLDGLLTVRESSGGSYQDRVEIYAWRDGVPVAVTYTNGNTLFFADGTSYAIYDTNVNLNVPADTASAETTFSTATGIDTFEIVYSNGSDDATQERYRPGWYSWWSDTQGNTIGASDDQAIRISGFGLVAADTANISGAVTVDTDNDGAGDSPLANVQLQLQDTLGNPVNDANGNPVAPVTTDSMGNYTFTLLIPDDYQVVEVQPADYTDVTDGDTTDAGDDTPNTDTLDNIIPVSVTASETDSGNDFVERAAAQGTITIVKQTDGNDATFTFSSADGDLNGLSIPTTGGTGTSTVITKTIGSYVITEDTLAGWGVTSITVSGDTDGGSTSSGSAATIDLDEGENIVVTFNNGEIIACGTNAATDLGGTIWRDFDSDGLLDANESGFTNVTVTAYDNNGLVTTAPVNSDGTYNFDDIFNGRTGDDAHIRLEFSGLPDWATSGVQGTNSGTTVQHHSAASCAADLAVQNPTDFCQADPPLTVACYLQPLDATATAWTDEPAIVQIPYESGTTATDTSAINTVEDEAFKTILATNGEVGSVFGLAFDQGEGIIYTSAFMKRHVPYGPSGVDAIYKIDGTGVSTFVDLHALVGGTPAGTDEHSPNVNNYQEDDVWDAVGKSSFAGLAISEDGSTLYVVTMTDADRQLYKINVPADGTNPLAADVQSFVLPSPADCPAHPSTGGGELNHNLRPGALEYSDGTLYVGLTCTAESTQDTGDLKGYVYTFDPTNNTFGSTPLLTIPFNYARTNVTSNPVVAPGAFNPWTTVQMTFATSPALNGRDDNASYPMPWLMDIGFADDGCMVLGIADRFGHLSSGRNSPPVQLNGNAGGDILKACNLSSTWTLESNGNDGVNPATAGAGTNSGPGNGEFFHDEAFDMVSDTYHTEISNGAFAILRGKEEVVLGVYDPAPRPGTLPNGATAFDSGGLAYLSTVDGSRTRSYMLFNRLENGGETGNGFDKASATGDIVAFCDAAPLEIGNYVWLDEDGDGIQDPCEEPIPGVTVELLDAGGASLATAVTDANGEYYFVDATDPRLAAGGVYETVPISVGVATSLTPSTTYQIRIDTTQAAVSAYSLTTANANSGSTLPDGVDSDATQSGDYAIIDIVTPEAGHNDHTFDFGFKPSSVVVGNRVWYDANDNGVIDGFENSYGIDGVTVELLDSTSAITATTTTTNGGFYLFTTNLNGDLLQDGDYQVRIPATNNMGAAGSALPLDDWRSSTDTGDAADPNTDVDSDDNGAGTTNGVDITSGTVSLAVGTEPDTAVDGDDTNGNLTVDFGFVDVCSTANGDLGGNVFRDFNSDGILDTNEPGWLDGITVTAYDNDGNVTTTTINPDGSYDFDAIFPNPVTDADHIRLEFSGLPDWATAGVAGTNSGTTVQHHKTASCGADLAVQNPTDYCQSNPKAATSCYVNGDQSVGSDALVTWSYTNRGTDTLDKASVSATDDIASVWGLAYNRTNETLYASAFVKRHVGLTAAGADAIFTIDPNTGVENGTLWLELEDDLGISVGSVPTATVRNLPADVTQPSTDADVFPLVGKVGLGDLDISEDMQTLWVMNLADKTVYAIDIATKSINGSYAVPNHCPVANDNRPFAVKYHDGAVYVGTVCSAESSQDVNDLRAYIYQLPDDGVSTTMTLVNLGDRTDGGIDLDYEREYAASDPGTGDCRSFTGWYPWANTFNPLGICDVLVGPKYRWVYPTPILSNIEFDDDGSIILAFMDRSGHQGGSENVNLDASVSRLEVVIGGDLLRACKIADGTYTFEGSDASCAQTQFNGSGSADTTFGEFEYYNDDSSRTGGTAHMEASLGSAIMLVGSGEVVMTMMDPTGDFDEGGVGFFDNITGLQTDQYRVYKGDTDLNGLFAKAAGLGELTMLCDAAPLEIGNYVWLDEDGDGIQDPCEEPIAGVTVELLDAGGTSLAAATTDANGEYYFVDATDPRLAAGGIYETVPISVGVATSLTPSTTYQIRIDTTQAAVSAYELTTANVASGTTLPDAVDSDGVESGNNAVISLTTGNAGSNDHTFDFGFKESSVRIGNRVWIDSSGNGLDDSETGVDGVTVELLNDAGTVISTTTTANGGYYLFTTDNTGALLHDGDYQVRIPASNFGDGQPLQYYQSTSPDGGDPDNDTDLDDNGPGSATGADVTSDLITVSVGGEPTTDGDDANGNLTVDFGFYLPPASLSAQKTLVTPTGAALVGETVSFQLRIENTGQMTVTELLLTDTYDTSGLQFSGASIAPDLTSTGVLTWTGTNGGTDSLAGNLPLAPGGVVIITVDFVAIEQ